MQARTLIKKKTEITQLREVHSDKLGYKNISYAPGKYSKRDPNGLIL